MYSKLIHKCSVISAVFLLSCATISLSAQSYSVPAAASASIAVSAGPGRPAPVPQNPNVQTQLNQSIQKGITTNSPVNYYNWSGYADTATTPFVAAESTFTQPVVSCPVPGAWTVFWVGFDGFSDSTVEQAGTAAQCGTQSNSQPVYYAWWEMYPTNSIQVMPITINPGDTIHANVTYNASNSTYALSVSDKSNKQQYTQQETCASGLTCARQSAEWIVERPSYSNGAYAPLANWGVMDLNNSKAAITANTKLSTMRPIYRPITAFSNTPINMINPATYPTKMLANAGSLNSKGTDFSDTWTAAQ